MLEYSLEYFREDKLPHILCAGCGHGIFMGVLARSLYKTNWEKDEIVLVSGIGCSSRLPGYFDLNTLHTLHGRAIPFATGVKLANPELKVIVITGDGDCAAIGGNHFIHGARRNIDITVFILNNNIYGMTGGQFSPTTPIDAFASTSPYGNIERNFDLVNLAIAAGANYVARGDVYNVKKLEKLSYNALISKGFSVVDVVSICPTYYGRKNRLRTPVAMMEFLKNNTKDIKQLQKLSEEEKKKYIATGEFIKRIDEDYLTSYKKRGKY